MIIDNANLLSATSPATGIDGMQSTASAEDTVSGELLAFSEALVEKINQLQALDISNYASDSLSADDLDSGKLLPQIAGLMNGSANKQQDIAGLSNSSETLAGLVSFTDNELSQEAKLETEIDLDNTLETLTNVLNSLEEQKDELGEDVLVLGAQIATEIESLEKTMPKAISKELGQQQDIEISVDGVDEFIKEVDMENSMGVPAMEASNFQAVEKGALPISPEVKAGLNKENLSLRQAPEEQVASAAIPAKSEAEIPMQKNNIMTEAAQKNFNAMLAAKQNEKGNGLETKVRDLDVSMGTEKALPKYAMDIANLNRAVISENKSEIPPMTKHFAHPEWNKEVGERVVWMHKQAIPSAELRLNPAHLGPVTIKVETTQDQVSVAFTAHHAAVKEAIDAALPKLREMLTAQQLNLSEVSVSQEDPRQKQHQGFGQMGSDAGKGEKQANEMGENGQAESTMDIADEIEAGRAIASNGVLSIFA